MRAMKAIKAVGLDGKPLWKAGARPKRRKIPADLYRYFRNKNPGHDTKDSQLLFNQEAINDLDPLPYKSRDILLSMLIDDFVSMAAPVGNAYLVDKIQSIEKALDEGTPLRDIPQLGYEIKNGIAYVRGHEGRHRAKVLKARGFTHMPVRFYGNIRWDQQSDPTKIHDYVKEWPEILVSENKKVKMPFPVTRKSLTKSNPPASQMICVTLKKGNKTKQVILQKDTI